MHAHSEAAIPERCTFEHKVFSTLGEVAFRRSAADGVAMMSVHLGEREAFIPLNSLRREFAIADDTPDGRMLELIGNSLDFVACLQPGDKLPLEVRTGEASWRPSASHRIVAGDRLRRQFVAGKAPSGEADLDERATPADAAAMAAVGDELALHQNVLAAAHHAAIELGLAQASDVVALIDDMAQELAYIEALRDRLLMRVEQAGRCCAALGRGGRINVGLTETVRQVVRLISIAYRQLRTRFEDVDAQTGETMNMLRNVESQRRFIRFNRDWLYRSQRAWDPLLTLWDAAPQVIDDATALLFTRTYQFLAPRFMPTTEWPTGTRQKRRAPVSAGMTW